MNKNNPPRLNSDSYNLTELTPDKVTKHNQNSINEDDNKIPTFFFFSYLIIKKQKKNLF